MLLPDPIIGQVPRDLFKVGGKGADQEVNFYGGNMFYMHIWGFIFFLNFAYSHLNE